MRLRYLNRHLGVEKSHEVTRRAAVRTYECFACPNEIRPGDDYWLGSNVERVCLDCPNATVAPSAPRLRSAAA